MMSINMFGLQDRLSQISLELNYFHDIVIVISIIIRILVGGVIIRIITNRTPTIILIEGQLLEWVWTLIPGLVLIFIALPSISLMYLYDETVNFEFSIKCIGQQWYWSYEYPESISNKKPNLLYDSYMKPNDDLSLRDFRLLDVDQSLIIPVWTTIQILISSDDVLHAWTIPGLGIKIDAVPGRINNLLINCSRVGIFYGQCSEICGAYHRFMPIKLEVLNIKEFFNWLSV